MKLQLVSHPLCPFVHRSVITLIEKDVPYELTYIDLTNKPEWFLELSPRGKIPVLVADGTPLFESAAINEFLDETHAPRLMPEDAMERARQRAWIEVANDLFAAHGKLITAPSAAELEPATAALGIVLARFEKAAQGPFFAGETLGVVDIAVAPAFHRMAVAESESAPPLLAKFPKVAAWAQRLVARPSTTRAVPPDFSERYLGMLRERGGYFVKELMAPRVSG
ncbi:MAG: Glutathione S-transferase [bacterium]|nr:Glutathione S-transferase [bacterium]